MRRLPVLATLSLTMCAATHATVLFSDTFESYSLGALPTGGNWATNFSGAIVNDPFSAGHGQVLDFNSSGSGGDLFSQLITYVPATNHEMQISFDIALTFALPATSGHYAYVGQDSATFPCCGHTELWTLGTDGVGFYEAAGNGGPYVSDPTHVANTWYHIVLDFFPFNNTNFAIKFETSANQAFIDNIVVLDNAPEPATWAFVGTGLAGLALLRKRLSR